MASSTTAENRDMRSRRSTAALLLEFLGSMNLAIALLVTLAIASVIGTVLVQNEPYNDYFIRFGGFWFEAFRVLGLYDVYSAGWFLGILGFLVVSTSVCIYRNAPAMLRDMRRFRLNVQARSLRGFHHGAEWVSEGESNDVEQAGTRCLTRRGYRARRKDHGDHVVVAANRGAFNRLGYVFTHLAIVVICVGGLIDGKIGLKLKEMTGEIQVLTEDMPVDQVPPISRLNPGDSLSFRGTRTVPEGSTVNAIVLNVRDGYVLQGLPFAIGVKDFRVQYYDSGQPKSFESDLVIHDDRLEEPLEKTIAVNHPLVYRGYAIYQSSFGDGGSHLRLKAWPLLGPWTKPFTLEGDVFSDVPVNDTPAGPLTVELSEFRMFNINPVEDPESDKKFRNWGPSFTYRVRDAAGQAHEYRNFMLPIEREGRSFFMSGVRSSPSEGFQYLRIPADRDASLQRFMRLRTVLTDRERIAQIVADFVDQSFAERLGRDPERTERLETSLNRMVRHFAEGRLPEILDNMKRDLPPKRAEAMREVYLNTLVEVLTAVYREVLREEGVDVSQGITDPFDRRFFEDAFFALSALPNYGAPFYLQLTSFDQVEATGLQITRAPGKNLVYLGSALLIAGVFIMFYVPHRRAWLYLVPEGAGATRVLFGLTSNRRSLDLGRDFERLRAELGRALPEKPGS